jgi:hypothetical protein
MDVLGPDKIKVTRMGTGEFSGGVGTLQPLPNGRR